MACGQNEALAALDKAKGELNSLMSQGTSALGDIQSKVAEMQASLDNMLPKIEIELPNLQKELQSALGNIDATFATKIAEIKKNFGDAVDLDKIMGDLNIPSISDIEKDLTSSLARLASFDVESVDLCSIVPNVEIDANGNTKELPKDPTPPVEVTPVAEEPVEREKADLSGVNMSVALHQGGYMSLAVVYGLSPTHLWEGGSMRDYVTSTAKFSLKNKTKKKEFREFKDVIYENWMRDVVVPKTGLTLEELSTIPKWTSPARALARGPNHETVVLYNSTNHPLYKELGITAKDFSDKLYDYTKIVFEDQNKDDLPADFDATFVKWFKDRVTV